MWHRLILGWIGLFALLLPAPAIADDLRGGGKLLLTNGISSIEGAAGGGLTPWAVIAGNETRDGIGVQASVTQVSVRDYDHRSASVAVGAFDRVELSYARLSFDTDRIGGVLGIGNHFKFKQDVYGIKLKLLGDAVYGPAALPAIAVGGQLKKSLNPAVVTAIGARHRQGVDLYLSATKLVLARSILASATARLTKANQSGLLGFGGASDKRSLRFEGSLAYQLDRRVAIGGEFRTKPDRLGFAREDSWCDAFAAYAVNRRLTATIAYVDLGAIATRRGQRGALFQLQASL